MTEEEGKGGAGEKRNNPENASHLIDDREKSREKDKSNHIRPKKKVQKRKEEKNSLIMHRDRHIRPYQPHQLNPLLRIHRHHQQRQALARNGRAAQMHEHEIDMRVALRDLGQLGHEQGVAGDVDAVAGFEV